MTEDQYPTPVSDEDEGAGGLLTLDEDEPTIRGRALESGAVAHEGQTELPSVRSAQKKGGLDQRLEQIGRRLARRLAEEET